MAPPDSHVKVFKCRIPPFQQRENFSQDATLSNLSFIEPGKPTACSVNNLCGPCEKIGQCATDPNISLLTLMGGLFRQRVSDLQNHLAASSVDPTQV